MGALKGAGAILAGIVVFVALVFLTALYIAGLAWVSVNIIGYLIVAATIAFAVCVFVLIPCALFRATRKFSVYGLFISSVIFGATTWILGFLEPVSKVLKSSGICCDSVSGSRINDWGLRCGPRERAFSMRRVKNAIRAM